MRGRGVLQKCIRLWGKRRLHQQARLLPRGGLRCAALEDDDNTQDNANKCAEQQKTQLLRAGGLITIKPARSNS